MATAILDLGFFGVIALILWFAQVQERWLDRGERELPTREITRPEPRSLPGRERDRRPPRAA